MYNWILIISPKVFTYVQSSKRIDILPGFWSDANCKVLLSLVNKYFIQVSLAKVVYVGFVSWVREAHKETNSESREHWKPGTQNIVVVSLPRKFEIVVCQRIWEYRTQQFDKKQKRF